MPDNRTPQEIAVACLDCGSIRPRRGVYRQEALADLTRIIAGVGIGGTPIQAGICPKCGQKLTYSGYSNLDADVLVYDVHCDAERDGCGFHGQEVHAVTLTNYYNEETGEAIEEQQAA